MSSEDEQIQQRRANLAKLGEMGVSAYPHRFDRTDTIGDLVGAYFDGHPDIQNATIQVEEPAHPAVASLPRPWTRRDEWYNFRRNPRGNVTVLATLDERSYSGGTMAPDHPIIWSHNYEGGRALYTALGHTQESFAEASFVEHLGRAILWAAGAPGPPSP